MYDPGIGKWISEDPTGFEAGDANLPRYVGNNATNETDPSGLQAISPRQPVEFGPEGDEFSPDATQEEVEAALRRYKVRQLAIGVIAGGPTVTRTLKNREGGSGKGLAGLKKKMQDEYGLPDVTELSNVPNRNSTGAAQGQGIKCQGIPPFRLVGTGGTGPCIGLIIFSPAGGKRPSSIVHVYHFDAGDDPSDTLKRDAPFPPSSKAVLFGGNNKDAVSMGTLRDVQRFLEDPKNKITIDGYYNSAGLWGDKDGDYFVRPAEVREGVVYQDGTLPRPTPDPNRNPQNPK